MGRLLVSALRATLSLLGWETGNGSAAVVGAAGGAWLSTLSGTLPVLGFGRGDASGVAESAAWELPAFLRNGAAANAGSTRFEMRLRAASRLAPEFSAAPLAAIWFALSVCRLQAM